MDEGRQDAALGQARHRPAVPQRQLGQARHVACVALQQQPAGLRSAEAAGHGQHVARPRTGPRRRRRRPPEHRHGQHQRRRPGDVAAHHRTAARHGALGHAAVHGDRLVRRPGRSEREADHRAERLGTHGREVGHGDRERLPAEVGQSRRGAPEVHVLDRQVGRHDEVGRQHRRVVADRRRHARAGRAESGRQSRDQVELAHLAAMVRWRAVNGARHNHGFLFTRPGG